MSRSRALGGAAAKGGLVLALALSVGGYTVAESAEQRAEVQAQQAERVAEQAAVRAAAEEHREAVAAERQRAVATAQDAVADAEAVRTVAASAVTEADLAPLLAAVDALNLLLQQAPTAPIPEADAAATEAPAVARDERASRAAERGAAPTTAAPADAATALPVGGAQQPVADATASGDGATRSGDAPEGGTTSGATDGTTSDDTPAPETAPGEGGVDGATEPPAPADDAAPEDELSAEILAAVAAVTAETARVQATADANLAAQQAAAAAAAEAAAAAAAEAAAKEAQRVSLDAYANGRVPADALCDLAVGEGHQLRCDAAEALAALDAAYAAEFGTPLTVSDSYRSYAAQVACRRVKGSLCAVPGTSNHGRGVAVDLAGGVERFGTRQHRWMEANADAYGWDLPDWASRGGSKPEPWHWEYVG